MGKPTGFMEYDRKTVDDREPLERISDFDEFHIHLKVQDRRRSAQHDNKYRISVFVSWEPSRIGIEEWSGSNK